MTPEDFVAKWKGPQDERRSSQSHFLDLCKLLGEADPKTADPEGNWFGFEKGATKVGGGDGWADVWRRDCFGWEYKTTGRDLGEAHRQLQRYAPALDNPPLLIVSDFARYRVHTHWTNRVSKTYEFRHEELLDAANRQLLAHAFRAPERLQPDRTRQQLTREAADKFADLAQRLRVRGYEAHRVAHFVNRLVFCMFAEDVDLLPDKIFSEMLKASRANPDAFAGNATQLFRAMGKSGGSVGFKPIAWFNGGLFDDDDALPLEAGDIREVILAADLDWSDIDPSILGTLFERGLDPTKRSQLGAHYTDRDKIMLIVNPVIVEPLTREWEGVKASMTALVADADAADARRATTRRSGAAGAETRKANDAREAARGLHREFVERLKGFRVLDPACGSGNFLYLSLRALKDIEHRANVDAAELLAEPIQFPAVGPECVKGIEINPFAAELARVSVWIGEIQWMRAHGFDAARNPILRPLSTIECRDALLNADGTRAEWPAADVVVGNPPFLGTKRMLAQLGVEYTTKLRKIYNDISPFSDLVCWWFSKSCEHLNAGKASRVGLVATNSIRGGKNRLVLDRITHAFSIYSAWGDEPWVVDGAAVRVSIVCFSINRPQAPFLNGTPVDRIHADLTAGHGDKRIDLTKAKRLPENGGIAFVGTVKSGQFDIDRTEAVFLLRQPTNPNGRPNSDVILPWKNGLDVVRRPQDKWIIDFGIDMPEQNAALFEAPFQIVTERVKPLRSFVNRKRYREYWWLQAEPCSGMRREVSKVKRYIATPTVAKHRLMVWLDPSTQPDHQLIAIARDDDTTFGILHSRFHELWSLRMGTSLEDRPRYTPSTTFETFPFPEGLTPNIPAAHYADDPRAQKIAVAAAKLNELRENWLNPADLVRREPEVVPGYPDRMLPVSEEAAKVLKDRTLTKLYNARPTWLANAHATLDAAVAAAYGWADDHAAGRLTDDEILARLFALNQARAGKT